MKKVLLVIGVAVLLAVAVICWIVIAKRFVKTPDPEPVSVDKPDKPGKPDEAVTGITLKTFRYSAGSNDMAGDKHVQELKKNDKGDWIIEVNERTCYEEPLIVTTYAVSEEDVLEFEGFLRQKKFASLAERPDSDYYILDESPWNYYAFFKDEEGNTSSFSFDAYKEFTDEDYALMKGVDEKLEAMRGKQLSRKKVND